MKVFLIVLGLCISILSADALRVGSKLSQLNNFKYETPNGREMRISRTLSLLIVAFEKDTVALVNEYLNTKNPFYLQRKGAIFIADIHEMPTVITNMFALPKIRKYKHLIYLHYNDKFNIVMPNKKEKITLLHVADGKIENISYISTKQELKAIIEK